MEDEAMSKGINKVFLLGNIGKAPELRTTGGGMLIATFSLATADRKKDDRGNWVDFTEWHSCIAFGRTAEIIRDYAPKGSRLHIDGKLQTQSWDDKVSGQKRYRTQVIVNDLTLLGSPQGNRSVPDATGDPDAPIMDDSLRGNYPDPRAITDDDIPF
jgi:single-strand DNA-binding protein